MVKVASKMKLNQEFSMLRSNFFYENSYTQKHLYKFCLIITAKFAVPAICKVCHFTNLLGLVAVAEQTLL